jgi:6-phosphogluconolactonase
MSTEILRAKDSIDQALQKAARRVFEVLSQKRSDEPLVLGLCGGRSVVGLLKVLRSEVASQAADLLARVQFFMVDERIVPLSSTDSNFGGLHTAFFSHLITEGLISATQLHPFEGSIEGAVTSCADYMKELARFGGRFSVVVLGMGEDGHVAGLFPEHPVLKRSGKSFECFFDSPKPPAARMTASRDLVTSSDLGIVLALGEGKRSAWEAFQDTGIPESQCPAKMSSSMKNCLVLTDLE